MNLLTKICLTVSLMSVVGRVNANDYTGKIVDLITWSDGHSVVKLENGPMTGCPGKFYYSLGVKGQDIKAEAMLSVALAALMSGKPVTIASANGICQGGEEKLTYIRISVQ